LIYQKNHEEARSFVEVRAWDLIHKKYGVEEEDWLAAYDSIISIEILNNSLRKGPRNPGTCPSITKG